jgi:hypothetical protein
MAAKDREGISRGRGVRLYLDTGEASGIRLARLTDGPEQALLCPRSRLRDLDPWGVTSCAGAASTCSSAWRRVGKSSAERPGRSRPMRGERRRGAPALAAVQDEAAGAEVLFACAPWPRSVRHAQVSRGLSVLSVGPCAVG